MKDITVTNFKGDQYSGKWNGKIYSSTIADREDLFRIYLDNEKIHITKEEYERVTNCDSEKADKYLYNEKMEKRYRYILEQCLPPLDEYAKCCLLAYLLDDEKVRKYIKGRTRNIIVHELNEKIFNNEEINKSVKNWR